MRKSQKGVEREGERERGRERREACFLCRCYGYISIRGSVKHAVEMMSYYLICLQKTFSHLFLLTTWVE
jgi:hypothetical protein